MKQHEHQRQGIFSARGKLTWPSAGTQGTPDCLKTLQLELDFDSGGHSIPALRSPSPWAELCALAACEQAVPLKGVSSGVPGLS